MASQEMLLSKKGDKMAESTSEVVGLESRTVHVMLDELIIRVKAEKYPGYDYFLLKQSEKQEIIAEALSRLKDEVLCQWPIIESRTDRFVRNAYPRGPTSVAALEYFVRRIGWEGIDP